MLTLLVSPCFRPCRFHFPYRRQDRLSTHSHYLTSRLAHTTTILLVPDTIDVLSLTAALRAILLYASSFAKPDTWRRIHRLVSFC